jgi:uncharacterized repeat protein (TIGR01451 family)
VEGTGAALGDLSLAVVASPLAPARGTLVQIGLAVTNLGSAPVGNVTVAHQTPPGLTFVSSVGPFDPVAGTWTIPTLAAGATASLTINARVADGGPEELAPTAIPIQAYVSAPGLLDSNMANNSAEVVLHVDGAANLTLSLTSDPAQVAPAGTLTYTATVSNQGPDFATSLLLSQTLPTGATLVTAMGDGWSCSASGATVNCTRPSLGSTTTAPVVTVTIQAPSLPGTTISSTASVAAIERDDFPGGNVATATNQVSTAGTFFSTTPCRLIDTRTEPYGTYAGPALTSGVERLVPTFGKCGVPATAKALAINVTATGATSGGFIRLYPGGTTPTATSSLNVAAGQTRANNAVVPLAETGVLGVLADLASGTTHIILDVSGYFE